MENVLKADNNKCIIIVALITRAKLGSKEFRRHIEYSVLRDFLKECETQKLSLA